MSVYTTLNQHDFDSILSQYSLGRITSFEGIAAGIENTNYKIHLQTSNSKNVYFLTIFEQLDRSALDFFIPFLAHLKQQGCALPAPKANFNGEFLFRIHNKWGVIFECLEGAHLDVADQKHAYRIGEELARIHLAAKSFSQPSNNPRGFYWLLKQVNNPQLQLSESDLSLLKNEMHTMQQHWQAWSQMDLSKSFIHGDLFLDNCLFTKDDKLSGVIDFYAGGFDYCVYDIAICIMAWAQTPVHQLDQRIAQAIVDGYTNVKSLSLDEKNQLPNFIRLAVIRFWVSRLIAQSEQQGAALTTFKDPNFMKQLLLTLP